MKKIIKLLIVFILTINVVYAATSGSYNDGSARIEYDDLGVHKKWNINENNKSNVLRTPLVDSSLKVYDYADILSEENENEIKNLIGNFIEHTNMDMVFLTVNMSYYNDKVNEDYAADFYDYNDFGLDFKNYSGVLLLRNAYQSDPYYNVYTFGDAQLYFDYDRCENMLDNIYYDFKNSNYLEGFKIFVKEFTDYYDSGVVNSNNYVDKNGYVKQKFVIPYGRSIIISAGMTLILMLILIGKNKMVKKAKNAKDYLDRSSINYKTKTDMFINTFTTRSRVSSNTGGYGGFSSSGSSGGGHGGGGGRHG